MMHEKLGSKGTHCLYNSIKSENDKVDKVESDKNKFKNYIQTTCTSADPGENMCKAQKDWYKIV